MTYRGLEGDQHLLSLAGELGLPSWRGIANRAGDRRRRPSDGGRRDDGWSKWDNGGGGRDNGGGRRCGQRTRQRRTPRPRRGARHGLVARAFAKGATFRQGPPPLVATVVATGGAGNGNVVIVIVDGLVEVQVRGRKAAFMRGEGV